MSNLIEDKPEVYIKRRLYGARPERKHVPRKELSAYRAKGWVLYDEPEPEPEKPDIEVIELQLKDAKADLAKAEEEARKIVVGARGLVSNLDLKLQQARGAVDAEPMILAEEQKIKDDEIAIEKAVKIMKGNLPIPERVLRGAMHNKNQEQRLSDVFLNNGHYIGKDEAGDRLFVLNKESYRHEEAARKAQEEKVREDAIRARMEVK